MLSNRLARCRTVAITDGDTGVKNSPFRTIVPLALIATTILSGCQTTGNSVRTLIFHIGALNPDCSPTGRIIARIARNPDHGSVTIRSGSGYIAFARDNPRYHCTFRETKGVNIQYIANPGFAGHDSTVVDTILPSGEKRQFTFDMNVN
jgi:hypothetical protein